MLTSAAFWRATLERAVRTFAQALIAAIAVGVAGTSLGVTDVDWGKALSVAGLATVLSVLTSVATSAATKDGPGITETPTPPPDGGV